MTAGPRKSARVTGSPGWKQEVRHFSPGSSGFVEGHADRRSRCGDCCLRGGEGATGCSAFRASSAEDKPVPGPLAGAAGPGTPTASHVTTPGTGPSCFSRGGGAPGSGRRSQDPVGPGRPWRPGCSDVPPPGGKGRGRAPAENPAPGPLGRAARGGREPGSSPLCRVPAGGPRPTGPGSPCGHPGAGRGLLSAIKDLKPRGCGRKSATRDPDSHGESGKAVSVQGS